MRNRQSIKQAYTTRQYSEFGFTRWPEVLKVLTELREGPGKESESPTPAKKVLTELRDNSESLG